MTAFLPSAGVDACALLPVILITVLSPSFLNDTRSATPAFFAASASSTSEKPTTSAVALSGTAFITVPPSAESTDFVPLGVHFAVTSPRIMPFSMLMTG